MRGPNNGATKLVLGSFDGRKDDEHIGTTRTCSFVEILGYLWCGVTVSLTQ